MPSTRMGVLDSRRLTIRTVDSEHGTARLPSTASIGAVRRKRPCERRSFRVSYGEAYFFPRDQGEQERIPTPRCLVLFVVRLYATTPRRVSVASSPPPLSPGVR